MASFLAVAAAQPRLTLARRFAAEADCAWHVHDAHELVLLTAGRCDIACGEQRLAGRVGTLFVLPQGLPQYQTTHGFTRTSYICFTAARALFAPAAGTVQVALDSPPARWFEDICDLDEQPGGADEATAAGLLQALLAWLGRARPGEGARDAVHPALGAATALITRRLRQPLDLPRLAAHTGVSAVHLSRLFRARFGCGPLRWQQRLRLRAAERLLTTTTRPLAGIAAACGYEDVNYFIRLFRERYRVTPGQWRGARRGTTPSR